MLGGGSTVRSLQGKFLLHHFIAKVMASNAFLLWGRISSFNSQLFSLACCFVTTKHQIGLRKGVWYEVLRHLKPSSSPPQEVEGDQGLCHIELPL